MAKREANFCNKSLTEEKRKRLKAATEKFLRRWDLAVQCMQNCVCAYLLCFMLSLRCKLVKRCVLTFTTLSCLHVSLSCIQATAQDEVRAGTVTLSWLHVSLFFIQATTRDEVRACTNHIVMRACRLCFGKEQPEVHEETTRRRRRGRLN